MWTKRLLLLTVIAGVIWLTHFLSQPEVSELCSYSMKVSFPEYDANDVTRPQFLYDARPLFSYINYVPFNWSHWVDLEDTKHYENKDLDPEQFPLLTSLDPGKQVSSLTLTKSTWQEKMLIGKLYCKHELSIPYRVIHVLDNKDVRQYKPWHHDRSLLHRQMGHILPSRYYTLNIKPQEIVTDRTAYLYPRLSPDDFVLPVEEMLKSDDIPEQHKQSLYTGDKEAPTAGKYFFEIEISDPRLKGGNHYDWRFFRGFVGFREHQKVLHRIAVDWQAFAEAIDLYFWYGHGSMLGYRWNGMTLPWDTDHDIQMPVRALDRLAGEFNRTVVAVGDRGLYKYLIDMNPYYVERIKGNGKNLIDGRFIDMQTGLYIDITGLAQTDPAVPKVYCKNLHSYTVENVTKIRRTQFEGHHAFMQENYEELLKDEYPRYANVQQGAWAFNSTDKLWHSKPFVYEPIMYDLQYEMAQRFYEIELANQNHETDKLFDLVYPEIDTSQINVIDESKVVVPEIAWTCQDVLGEDEELVVSEVVES